MPGAQIENANLPAEVTGLRLPAWCAAAAAGRGVGQAPRASPAPSAGCVTVLARERRNHLPGALEDPLMQLAFDDRPQDRFLALGVPLVGHLAGPHPGGRAPQMRVSVAARTRRSPGPAQRVRRGGRWRPAARARTAPSV